MTPIAPQHSSVLWSNLFQLMPPAMLGIVLLLAMTARAVARVRRRP